MRLGGDRSLGDGADMTTSSTPGLKHAGGTLAPAAGARARLLLLVWKSVDGLHRETGLFEGCAKHGDRAPIGGVDGLAP
jgi:hypothetical protein